MLLPVPHSHPRGDEWDYTYAGSPTSFMVPQSSNVHVNYSLPPGMQAVYPQGTLHMLANYGCDTAKISAVFHNTNPGFVIPNFWDPFFPGFDTTIPPEAVQKLDDAKAALGVECAGCTTFPCPRLRQRPALIFACQLCVLNLLPCCFAVLQGAVAYDPSKGNELFQVYFRYAGFRPMPKASCSCPGRPSVDDYAASLDTERFKSELSMPSPGRVPAPPAPPSPPGPRPHQRPILSLRLRLRQLHALPSPLHARAHTAPALCGRPPWRLSATPCLAPPPAA